MRIGDDLVVSVREIERGPCCKISHEERVLVVFPVATHVGQREDPCDHAVVTRQLLSM